MPQLSWHDAAFKLGMMPQWSWHDAAKWLLCHYKISWNAAMYVGMEAATAQ
jgi:hypothetical protein